MSWYLDTALAGAAFGLVTGASVPEQVRALPEPEPDEDEDRLFGEQAPKERYADLAALPGLRWKAAVATAAVGGLVGLRLHWSWELLAVLLFAPVGVALTLVDARTRYLPTWLIGPMYGVVLLLAAVAALERHEWAPLVAAAAGWAVYGGFFTLIWLLLPAGGLGFGDVRLSGLLGLLLGFVHWGALAVGLFAGIFSAGLVSVVLLVARRRSHYPYGPYLLVGALVGVMFGHAFAHWYWP